MRISVAAACGLLVLMASRSAAAEEAPSVAKTGVATSRFTLGMGLEVALVGLSFGLRPELQYRLGPPGTISHLRTSVGLLFGREFTYVPVSIGYRAAFRQEKTVQPFVGAGLQSNFFLVTGGSVFSQLGVFYLEGGSGFAITDRFAVGGAATLEWSFLNELGPGLAIRAFGALKF